MRERTGAHLAEAVEFGHPLDPNHNITITHIFLTTKLTNYTNNEPVWIEPRITRTTQKEEADAGSTGARSGGVFAGPLPSELEDGPWAALRAEIHGGDGAPPSKIHFANHQQRPARQSRG
jgi:hypothetical protein